MNSDDEFPRNVFPSTDHYLFVGGPYHGKRREVVTTDHTHIALSKAESPTILQEGSAFASASAGYLTHTYVRRILAFEDEDGTRFTRAVFLHEEITDLAALLSQALMADFLRGGQQVIDGNVKSSDRRS